MEAYLEGKPDEPHVQQEEQPQQGESHEGQLYSKPANYMEQLTQDVFGLAMLLAPLPEERALRALLIELVVDICEDLWSSKQVQVSVFGSSAIGVYLHGSDIDIVVSAPATDPSMVLWKLYAQLKNQNWVAPMSLNMISKARVPVIKLVSIPRLGRIKMDIVANVQTGHASTELMKTWVATYPTLMPLALIIKLMLKQKGFDEVFTGGVGGYALLNMIVAVIIRDQQTFNKEYSGNPDRYASPDSVHSLGRLIWLFFEFYARQLDYGLNAIHITDDPLANVVTVRPDMGYASARYPSFSGGNSSLHIIDPTETSNNVTRGSFRFGELRQLFEEVLTDLEWHQSTLTSMVSPD
ncbi:hypothetical protein BSLG_000186 [Batrachochytrium salamandrivorans]|nr:hypothetical protein BSLG_000186 [Batrachochytrium salamandrivorans]